MDNSERSDFIRKINDLAKVERFRVDDLKYPYATYFEDVNEVLSRFKSGNERSNLIKIILSSFSEAPGDVPGTVGAHFKGCFITDDACSSSCIESIQRGDPCEFHVLDYNGDGNFTKYNSGDPREADVALINIVSQHFSGFNKEEIQILQEVGIRRVKIVGNSTFTTNEIYNLDDLLTKHSKNSIIDDNFDNDTEDSSTSEENESKNVWVWAVLGFVLFLFIILALFLFNMPFSRD